MQIAKASLKPDTHNSCAHQINLLGLFYTFIKHQYAHDAKSYN